MTESPPLTGPLVRSLRRQAGLNQFQLAEISGLSRATIQLIEQGRGPITPQSEYALRGVLPGLQFPPTAIEQVRAELEELRGRLDRVEARSSGQAA